MGDDNGRRATAAVMRYGYRRVECFGGYEPRCGERRAAARPVGARAFGFTKRLEARAAPGNAANPVRIGLQDVRTPRAEQAVEVVRIHGGGTRCAAGGAGAPKAGGNISREWTLREIDRRQGTNAGETQERRIRRLIQVGSWRAEGEAKLMEDALR